MGDQNALALAGNDKLRAIMRSPDTLARFAEVLGQHNASAYVTSVLLAVANNDDLQKCTPASIISSAMRAATLRLSCDPSTKQAHLVPFKGKATLVVGHKGFYDMATRTGRYRYLNDFRVYEGQEVVEDQLRGTIELQGYKKSDTVIGYGFYFEMVNGLKKVLYMTVEEIQAHGAKFSKTYNFGSSLWKTNFDAMARKTVIRLCLSRYGYLDPTDALTLQAVDESEGEDDYEVAEPAARPRRTINQNLVELGFEPEPETEPDIQPAQWREEAPEPPAEEEAPVTAKPDPYAELKEKAKTDPATAFWTLTRTLRTPPDDAKAIVRECKDDMACAFAALLKQAPPAN